MSVPEALTRAILANAVAREVSISRTAAQSFVNQILDHLSQSVSQDEDVKIPKFGTFYLIHKATRRSRHPRSGEMQQIRARRILRFRPSPAFVQQLNETALEFESRRNSPKKMQGPREGSRVSAVLRSRAAQARALEVMQHIDVAREGGASSLRQIAAVLNAKGITAPRGGPWGASQVEAVLARVEATRTFAS